MLLTIRSQCAKRSGNARFPKRIEFELFTIKMISQRNAVLLNIQKQPFDSNSELIDIDLGFVSYQNRYLNIHSYELKLRSEF